MGKLIIPTGYMGSGSSAMTDLISEIKGFSADYGSHEYVFLHCPNGLFDLEDKLLIGNNALRSDEALHIFYQTMKQLFDKKYWWVGHYKETFGEDFLKKTEVFIDSITSFKSSLYWYYQENTTFKMGLKLLFNRIIRVLSLGKINAGKPLLYPEIWVSYVNSTEFYNAAKTYLDQLFMNLKLNERNIILDQLLLPYNLWRLNNYFEDNVRVFVVERDPRDVFLLNKYVWHSKGGVVPYSINVEEFCLQYSKMRELEKKIEDKKIMRLNFEDLVYNYKETCQLIYEQLNVCETDHVEKGVKFNPKISIHNTQVFRMMKNAQAEVRYIEENLKKFLYLFPFGYNGDKDKIF